MFKNAWVPLSLFPMQKEKKDKHFIKKPVYPGGPKAMREFIRQNLRYPEEALKAKVEGSVTVRYDIDHLGKVVDAKIIAGLGYGCDEEAIRLVHLFRFEVPKTRGVRVRFHKNIHIHFRLPKQKAPAKTQTTVTYTVTPSPEKETPPGEEKQSGYTYTISY
jgi:protein TonB